MAILTMDDIANSWLPPEMIQKDPFTGEASGQLHSAWYLAGRPGAATAPATGVNGAQLTSPVSGQIPFPAAVVGKNTYLGGFDGAQGANIGSAMLVDRLWHNSALVVTTTGAQAIAHPGIPARDMDGASNGRGVMLALEVSTATTNGSAITNMTASYTNENGVAGRTATVASFPATAVAGTFVPFALAAGDQGVRSVQSVSFGTSLGGGAVHLVQYRPIDIFALASANIAGKLGPFEVGMPRLYDGSVPHLVYLLTGTAAGVSIATLTWLQG